MQRSFDLAPFPGTEASASSRMLECLEMYDEGVELQLLNFRRRFPLMTESELSQLVQSWLERNGES
jgi:hypothetical protein